MKQTPQFFGAIVEKSLIVAADLLDGLGEDFTWTCTFEYDPSTLHIGELKIYLLKNMNIEFVSEVPFASYATGDLYTLEEIIAVLKADLFQVKVDASHIDQQE